MSGASWVDKKGLGNFYVLAETLVCEVAVSDASWVTFIFLINRNMCRERYIVSAILFVVVGLDLNLTVL